MRTLLVAGGLDKDVPPELVRSFFDSMTGHERSKVELVVIEEADHYDLVNGETLTWTHILRLILEELKNN